MTSQPLKAGFLNGAFVGDGNWQAGHTRFTQATGRPLRLMLTFTPWRQNGPYPFPESFCRFAIEHEFVPVITWEPWEPWSGWCPRLADIAAGTYDRDIAAWADRAKRLRWPILVRFAHEMNGDWYPWCTGKDSRQSPQDYVAAWRHVHGVFQTRKADNVQFVWCPNFEPIADLKQFYPGDAFVDWVGLDMYNQPDWPRSPTAMLEPVYRFAERHNKPVILTEVGCAETFATKLGGDEGKNAWRAKDRWIEELFRAVADRPTIRGIIWFDVRKEADWRIRSSPSALAAYRRGLALLDSQRALN